MSEGAVQRVPRCFPRALGAIPRAPRCLSESPLDKTRELLRGVPGVSELRALPREFLDKPVSSFARELLALPEKLEKTRLALSASSWSSKSSCVTSAGSWSCQRAPGHVREPLVMSVSSWSDKRALSVALAQRSSCCHQSASSRFSESLWVRRVVWKVSEAQVVSCM